MVNIMWYVEAHGIGDSGARAACEPLPVFGTTSRVIHSAFVWFGGPIGEAEDFSAMRKIVILK